MPQWRSSGSGPRNVIYWSGELSGQKRHCREIGIEPVNGHWRSFRGLRGWMDSPRASMSTYSVSLRSRVVGRLTALSR